MSLPAQLAVLTCSPVCVAKTLMKSSDLLFNLCDQVSDAVLTWCSIFISQVSEPLRIARSGERHKLYNHWSEDLRQGWLDELKLAMREFERVRDDQRRIHADVDLNVLRGARLVGMTTAGVAGKQELVAAMCPKVPLAVLLLVTCDRASLAIALAMPHPCTALRS